MDEPRLLSLRARFKGAAQVAEVGSVLALLTRCACVSIQWISQRSLPGCMFRWDTQSSKSLTIIYNLLNLLHKLYTLKKADRDDCSTLNCILALCFASADHHPSDCFDWVPIRTTMQDARWCMQGARWLHCPVGHDESSPIVSWIDCDRHQSKRAAQRTIATPRQPHVNTLPHRSPRLRRRRATRATCRYLVLLREIAYPWVRG
jgi:hypothetical protein